MVETTPAAEAKPQDPPAKKATPTPSVPSTDKAPALKPDDTEETKDGKTAAQSTDDASTKTKSDKEEA